MNITFRIEKNEGGLVDFYYINDLQDENQMEFDKNPLLVGYDFVRQTESVDS